MAQRMPSFKMNRDERAREVINIRFGCRRLGVINVCEEAADHI